MPSTRYLGSSGTAYFAYQNSGGLRRGAINARKFAAYIKPDDVVLDFGCGSGALLYHLACRRRIGVEVNPSARDEAGKLGLEIYETLAPVDDNSVNLVISNHVLEHVLSPFETLCELRQKLAQRGKIVLCLPINDWRTEQSFDPNDINHHLYTWTPLLLGNLLGEAGYKLDRVWIYTHAWPPRYWQVLDRILPTKLFDMLCFITSVRLRRRQIMAIATKP